MKFDDDYVAAERDKVVARPVLSGWAIHVAALIDAESAGFLRFLFQTKGAHRHAVLAALAHVLKAHGGGDQIGPTGATDANLGLGQLGDRLRVWSPRETLTNMFGLVEGFGTFGRLVEPLEPSDYLALVDVLRDPIQRRRCKALRHIRDLDHDRLKAVLRLPLPLCTVHLAGKIRRESQAQIAEAALEIVKAYRSDLSDEEIFAFCGQGDLGASFSAQLQRLIALVEDLGPPPIDIPKNFRHLRTREDFEEVGRRFRNCLATKFLSEALTRKITYLEYLPRPSIAVLLPTSVGWMLSKVHAPRNAPAQPDLVDEIRAALSKCVGVLTPAPVNGPLACIRFALMPYDPFALGPDEFDISLPELD